MTVGAHHPPSPKVKAKERICWRGLTRLVFFAAGHNEGTISVAEGELLYVIEEDKGDGWTRVRRNHDEEGYVPTSYLELFLGTDAKGAVTYI